MSHRAAAATAASPASPADIRPPGAARKRWGRALATLSSAVVGAMLGGTLVFAPAAAPAHAWNPFTPKPKPTTSATPTPKPTPTTPAKPPVPLPDSAFVENPDRGQAAPPNVKPRGFVDAPGAGTLGDYYAQPLTWKPCVGQTECATITVPLDYDHPANQAIEIKLRRKKATKEPYLGPLFVNPGGPGGAGQALAAWFENKGLEQYDIVGFDPRGSGESVPVLCSNGAELDQYFAMSRDARDDAAWNAYVERSRAIEGTCYEQNGALLQHITTTDIAKDLETFRNVFKRDKLNYFGYSYGTKLGSMYMEIQGQHADHMVVDGVTSMQFWQQPPQRYNPNLITRSPNQDFEDTLHAFAKNCAARKCSIGSTENEVLASITGLWDSLKGKPLAVGKRDLTMQLAVDGTLEAMYSVDYWPILEEGVAKAKQGDGKRMLQLGDAWNGRQKDGTYSSSRFALMATNCTDNNDDGVAQVKANAAADRAPIFGKYGGGFVGCSVWPVRTIKQAKIDNISSQTPTLAIGTTGDPATPYRYAQDYVKKVNPTAVLLTRVGDEHCAYGMGNSCIDAAVVEYLTKSTLPPAGTTCRK